MNSAVVGHTGLVGGTLARAWPEAVGFNSSNIEAIAGREFDLLLVAGMPGTKWLANKDPATDHAAIERLARNLEQCRADRVVLFSTIDVYPVARSVDEDTPIDPAAQQPYGRHRLALERQLADRFPGLVVLRLPGLFGRGLKKNAIFDLLNNHETDKIQSRSVLQWYALTRLADDVKTALGTGLPLINLATEPLSVAEVAREGLGMPFENDPGAPPADYDMQSKNAGLFGVAGRYMYSREQVFADLRDFARAYRAGER
ncbi:MAG: hypothetical protein K1X57_06895 [Gemmataceae bacterium]|nr:hypothetical protein [Gemmataceae bacterium]